MQLTLSNREIEGVSILDLGGRIVLGEECETLRAQIKELLAGEHKHIVLNLAEVTRVDSSGIGILVEGVIVTAKEGGRLKLVHVPRMVHNTLAAHRLLPAFELFEDEQAAVRSFHS